MPRKKRAESSLEEEVHSSDATNSEGEGEIAVVSPCSSIRSCIDGFSGKSEDDSRGVPKIQERKQDVEEGEIGTRNRNTGGQSCKSCLSSAATGKYVEMLLNEFIS